MTDIHQHKILIIDFGSQYTQLIARRVRELGVYSEIFSCYASEQAIRAFAPNGIILSGGPESTTALNAPKAPSTVFELGCPVLGICYGLQTMTQQLAGQVSLSSKRELGYAKVSILHPNPLLQDIEDGVDETGVAYLDVWMSHGDHVTQLPSGFVTIGSTASAPHAAIMHPQKQWYGVQFHPEVTHTQQGKRILSRFVHDICQCPSQWTMANIVEDSVIAIRQQVQQDRVLVGLSGGVDSAVVAALLHKAIGDQLTCVFVDTGLLRKNEGNEVMRVFAQHLGVNVIRVNAEQQFLQALGGIKDPEKKRKTIGEVFIRVFEQQAQQMQGVKWLGQGTIYPDVIESAQSKNGHAHVIKSHHNVGGLPQQMAFALIEPLRELFKDEVRQLGLQLGLPSELINRHPFPGPGLGVRVLGEIKPQYVEILREADAIFIDELRQHDLYQSVHQAFAVFLPIKSVGVAGDSRAYEYVIALRAVETIDFMTARWAELPYHLLAKVSHRIINEIPNVSRVVYDISGKPPATIEWE